MFDIFDMLILREAGWSVYGSYLYFFYSNVNLKLIKNRIFFKIKGFIHKKRYHQEHKNGSHEVGKENYYTKPKKSSYLEYETWDILQEDGQMFINIWKGTQCH